MTGDMRRLILCLSLISFGCTARSAYPPDFQSRFMKSCLSKGGTEESCRCGVRKIQAKYDFEEYQRLYEEFLSKGKQPQDYQELIKPCLQPSPQTSNS